MVGTSPPPGYRYYRAEIEKAAAQFSLDPNLVSAVVWKESGFNADAFRHEPDFWNRYLKRKPEWAGSNPRRVSSSYGLMQVMYPVALEDGFDPTLEPEALFLPRTALLAGCRRLAKLIAWADAGWPQIEPQIRLQAALAAYNGGRGGNRPTDRPIRNLGYAKGVLALYKTLTPGSSSARG